MSVAEKMTAIADAIREKTGDTGKLSLDGMAEALRKLPGPIVATASGNPISLTDATDLKLRGLKLFGKTTQDGTPTPEAPVPLVSAGDGGSLGVTVAGKNLLPKGKPGITQNVKNVEFTVDIDGKITANGTASDFADFYIYGAVTDTGEYLFVPKGSKFVTYGDTLTDGSVISSGVFWIFREKTKGAIVGTTAINTVLATQDCYFYGAFLRVARGSTANNFISYAGIYGTTFDTSYEPYKEAQTLTLSTPNGLSGIPVTTGGNYTDETGQQWVCDEVDFGRGVYVQRCLKIVLNGSETGWDKNGASGGVYRNRMKAYMGIIQGAVVSQKADILCDCYKIDTADQNYRHVDSIAVNAGGEILFYDSRYNTNDISLWKAHLAENPITVVFVLATPIETALSAEELAAYATLHTNYPNTTILNNGGAGMEVKYVADTKLYIDNKINAMAAAIVNA